MKSFLKFPSNDNAIGNAIAKVKSAADKVNLPVIGKTKSDADKAINDKDEENSSKMLQIIDWAYEKANGNLPGFGTTSEMAKKYLEKSRNVSDAVDSIVKWHIAAASTAGFVSGLGGFTTLPLTLPANIVGVITIQLRMIGTIVELGGDTIAEDQKKTGMYLCLLGAQAGNILSKTASQFAVKFTMAALKNLPATVFMQINKAVGFRLFTKFGSQGLLNIHKAIPVLGGLVGAGIDACSTYAIAKAAKALFLGGIIDFEKQEKIEIEKIRLLHNLALLGDKKSRLSCMVDSSDFSEQTKDSIRELLESDKSHNIDFSLFEDEILRISVMSSAVDLAKADSQISTAELMYLKSIGKKLKLDAETVETFLKQ